MTGIWVGRRARSLVAAFALAGATGGWQPIWQADVRIERMDVVPKGELVSITVVIYSDNDANAENAALHLFLPVGATVRRVSPGCLPSPSRGEPVQARVDCRLGELRVRDSREVTIVANVPGTHVVRRFAAFAFSDTPDPVIANNYAERVFR